MLQVIQGCPLSRSFLQKETKTIISMFLHMFLVLQGKKVVQWNTFYFFDCPISYDDAMLNTLQCVTDQNLPFLREGGGRYWPHSICLCQKGVYWFFPKHPF